MPVSYVGSSPWTSGTGALSIDLSATGRLAGDFLLLQVESANQAVAAPAGWTQLASSPQGIGAAATAGATRLSAFWRISDGTESGVSVVDSGDHTIGQVHMFRGQHTTPIHAEAGTSAPAGTASLSLPALTTTIDNCLIVYLASIDRDVTSTNTGFSSWTNAALTGLTEIGDRSSSLGFGGGTGAAYGLVQVAASITAGTVTMNASQNAAAITIALRPAVTDTNLAPASSWLSHDAAQVVLAFAAALAPLDARHSVSGSAPTLSSVPGIAPVCILHALRSGSALLSVPVGSAPPAWFTMIVRPDQRTFSVRTR